MAEHSKVAQATSEGILQIILAAFVGSPQRKAFSAVLLGIIGYLIYMKNKKSSTDNIKIKDEPRKHKVRSLPSRKEEKDMLMPFFSKEFEN